MSIEDIDKIANMITEDPDIFDGEGDFTDEPDKYDYKDDNYSYRDQYDQEDPQHAPDDPIPVELVDAYTIDADGNRQPCTGPITQIDLGYPPGSIPESIWDSINGYHDSAKCSVEYHGYSEDGNGTVSTHWRIWLDDGRAGSLHLHSNDDQFSGWDLTEADNDTKSLVQPNGDASPSLQAILNLFADVYE